MFAAAVPTEAIERASDGEAIPSSDVSPYALVFEDGQSWTFAVETASTTTPPRVRCHVAEVELSCDHQSSTIVCDDENQIIGGVYTRTGRGLWRAEWNNAAPGELRDTTRMLARHPASLIDPGNGRPIARPFHGGWCVSDVDGQATRTICIGDDKGILGGSLIIGDSRVYVGDVPRS